MVVNQRVTGKAASIPKGIGFGILVSILVTLTGSTITALMVSKETIPESGIGYSAIIILLLSAFSGAMAAYRSVKHRRMVVCMVHGLCYYLILLGITALFFGGQYQGMGVTALAVLAGSGTVGLLGLKGTKHSNVKVKKILSR